MCASCAFFHRPPADGKKMHSWRTLVHACCAQNESPAYILATLWRASRTHCSILVFNFHNFGPNYLGCPKMGDLKGRSQYETTQIGPKSLFSQKSQGSLGHLFSLFSSRGSEATGSSCYHLLLARPSGFFGRPRTSTEAELLYWFGDTVFREAKLASEARSN